MLLNVLVVFFTVLVQDAIKATDVSLSLVKAIRDNVADTAETSQLYVSSERYLCERKDYLSFRGVLVKLYDFLAAKDRDVLSEWLKGGARHIVVSDRQINIKEGACGIALTTLEDPVCSKKAAGRGWESEWTTEEKKLFSVVARGETVYSVTIYLELSVAQIQFQ